MFLFIFQYLIKVNEIRTKKGVDLLQHLVEFYQAQNRCVCVCVCVCVCERQAHFCMKQGEDRTRVSKPKSEAA